MMRKGTLATLSLFVSLVPMSIVACGGGNDELPAPPAPAAGTASAVVDAGPAPSATVDAGPPAPPPPPVTLLPGAAAPDPAKAPTVKITAPTMEQVIPADKAGDFQVKLNVGNWTTATGAAHVHLILDNKPYKPIYDAKTPVKLSDLTKEPLAEGQHVLVAFPSRATHESVKGAGAIAVTEFWVGAKGTKTVDIKKPMLVYSRPKGDYKGDMANHVLVDFQLLNDKLVDATLPANKGKGDHVHVTVSGPGIEKDLQADATKFGPPFYLDNLQNGDYQVKLELVGGDGQLVAGPWNSTTRTIHVDHDGTPDPMPGMNMGGAAPAAGADAGAAPAATDAGK